MGGGRTGSSAFFETSHHYKPNESDKYQKTSHPSPISPRRCNRAASTSGLDDRKSGLEVDQQREQIGYCLDSLHSK